MDVDRERIAALTATELEALNERTGGSAELYRRANRVLSGGVASSYQLRDPWPLYLERGHGPKVWDVDHNELWDFHNGFGSMVQGHAHPAIGDAIMKIFGSYHGHHDAVMVSIGVEYGRFGPREAPLSLPYGAGIPQAIVDLTFSVHFNDAESLAR